MLARFKVLVFLMISFADVVQTAVTTAYNEAKSFEDCVNKFREITSHDSCEEKTNLAQSVARVGGYLKRKVRDEDNAVFDTRLNTVFHIPQQGCPLDIATVKKNLFTEVMSTAAIIIETGSLPDVATPMTSPPSVLQLAGPTTFLTSYLAGNAILENTVALIRSLICLLFDKLSMLTPAELLLRQGILHNLILIIGVDYDLNLLAILISCPNTTNSTTTTTVTPITPTEAFTTDSTTTDPGRTSRPQFPTEITTTPTTTTESTTTPTRTTKSTTTPTTSTETTTSPTTTTEATTTTSPTTPTTNPGRSTRPQFPTEITTTPTTTTESTTTPTTTAESTTTPTTTTERTTTPTTTTESTTVTTTTIKSSITPTTTTESASTPTTTKESSTKESTTTPTTTTEATTTETTTTTPTTTTTSTSTSTSKPTTTYKVYPKPMKDQRYSQPGPQMPRIGPSPGNVSPYPDCLQYDATSCGERPDGKYSICYPDCASGFFITCYYDTAIRSSCPTASRNSNQRLVFDPVERRCQPQSEYCRSAVYKRTAANNYK